MKMLNSPWEKFSPATLEFCEERLNGWIRQPANTWSNIGLIIVGIALWKRTPPSKAYLHIFSIGAFLIGITSTAYHSSMTFVAQFFDVSSMFLTAGILVVLNLMRLKWIAPLKIYRVLIFMQLSAMSVMFILKGASGEQLFTLQVIFILLSEMYLALQTRQSKIIYRWWVASFAIFGVSTFIWLMDIKKIWCDAENHWFNGHAAWHLLNATAIYTFYRFYEEYSAN